MATANPLAEMPPQNNPWLGAVMAVTCEVQSVMHPRMRFTVKALKIKTQTKYMEVLPKGVREYAEKLIANPKLARAFLVRTGIYTKSGKLTRHYR